MSQHSSSKIFAHGTQTTRHRDECFIGTTGKATANTASTASLPSTAVTKDEMGLVPTMPVEYNDVIILHVSIVVTPCKNKKSHNVPTMNHPDCALSDRVIENPYMK